MNFNIRKTNNNFSIGNLVRIIKVSSSSMNLYTKVIGGGLTNTKCPCNVKPYEILEIIKPIANGFYLFNKNTNKYTVAVDQDLVKVIE